VSCALGCTGAGNYLEQISAIVVTLLLAGLKFPRTAATIGLVCTCFALRSVAWPRRLAARLPLRLTAVTASHVDARAGRAVGATKVAGQHTLREPGLVCVCTCVGTCVRA
jgi:hypothetical protein